MFEETFAAAWERRFGAPPDFDPPAIDRFLAHRSVRHFLDRPIPESTVRGLVGAAQSAATSSNLQLWSVVSVQAPARRERLALLCADQDQVRRAAWFFAFLADHHRLAEAGRAIGQDPTGLDHIEFLLVAAIDAALAAERMVNAAEALGIGTCYIGALRNQPEAVRDALELPPQTFGLFGLCLGYPDPTHPATIKPRLKSDAVWFRETYGKRPDVSEYDARMTSFYAEQNMRGDITWTMRSARRADDHHMSGRERLRDILQAFGFARR